MLEKIFLKANAKVNLSLDVTGKRDDGYHLLDTVMQSVSLYDELEIKKQKDISVISNFTAINGENNICYKASKLFFEETGVNFGCEISIKKNIPICAGLGGGSADAAAVIIGLDRLYETKLSYKAMCDISLRLGADVPFFIGGGTARCKGIGEIITPIENSLDYYIIIAKNKNKLSTGEMFNKIDNIKKIHTDTDFVVSAIKNGDLYGLCGAIKNSFSVCYTNNELEKILKDTEAVGVSLSGSGPSFFGIYNDYEMALNAIKYLKEKDILAFLAKPLKKSIIID